MREHVHTSRRSGLVLSAGFALVVISAIAVAPAQTQAAGAHAADSRLVEVTRTDTFNFAGDALQSATPPRWASHAEVSVRSGRGGSAGEDVRGGDAAEATATILPTPGEDLIVGVGGAGASSDGNTGGDGGIGWPHGGDGRTWQGTPTTGNQGSAGGGGASGVFFADGSGLQPLIIVGGGGGAGGAAHNPGGAGGNAGEEEAFGEHAHAGSNGPGAGDIGGQGGPGGVPGPATKGLDGNYSTPGVGGGSGGGGGGGSTGGTGGTGGTAWYGGGGGGGAGASWVSDWVIDAKLTRSSNPSGHGQVTVTWKGTTQGLDPQLKLTSTSHHHTLGSEPVTLTVTTPADHQAPVQIYVKTAHSGDKLIATIEPEDGSASFQVPDEVWQNSGYGIIEIFARSEADQTYAEQTSGAIQIRHQQGSSTDLQLSASKITTTQALSLTATLTPDTAHGIVQFTAKPADSEHTPVTLGTATIEAGIATLNLAEIQLSPGTFEIRAVYPGDDLHAPSESSPNTLEIETPATSPITPAESATNHRRLAKTGHDAAPTLTVAVIALAAGLVLISLRRPKTSQRSAARK